MDTKYNKYLKKENQCKKPEFPKSHSSSNRARTRGKIFLIFPILLLLLTSAFGIAKIFHLKKPSSTKQVKESSSEKKLSLNDIIHESRKYLGSRLYLSNDDTKESTVSTAPALISKNEPLETSESSAPATALRPPTESFLVVIDPGHQQKADMSLEPVAPWSSAKKPKVTAGTKGVRTGIRESSLMLEISIMLKRELESKGVKVILTRETENVNISNKQRALVANSLNADLFLRLHANSSSNPQTKGALALYQQPHPSIINASKKSKTASNIILDIYCQKTGMKNLGIREGKDMTGLNWSKVPAVILELGFLSNPEDEAFMVSEVGKLTIVKAISEGVISYKNLLN